MSQIRRRIISANTFLPPPMASHMAAPMASHMAAPMASLQRNNNNDMSRGWSGWSGPSQAAPMAAPMAAHMAAPMAAHMAAPMPVSALPPHLRSASAQRQHQNAILRARERNRLAQAANNHGAVPVNNFTQRKRNSIAARRLLHPHLNFGNGQVRRSLANAVQQMPTKNTRKFGSIQRYVPLTVEEGEEKAYRTGVGPQELPIGNIGLSSNQSKVFANILASTNDLNSIKRRINRLPNSPEYKRQLRAHLNFLFQRG